MIKRGLLFLLCFYAVIPLVFSVPLEDLAAEKYSAQLLSSDEIIMDVQLKNPSPKLLPADDELMQFTAEIMNTLKPAMTVEALYLYKKPEQSHTDSQEWDEKQKNGLFNQLLALSTLAGIQYYSASRKTMRTFFEYSQVIDGLQKLPLPDPVFAEIPEELTLYARQIDLTFGDNIYNYSYFSTKDSIFFIQENITALNIKVIPAIRAGNLRTIMAVFDCGDVLLIYAVSMVKAVSFPGMGERIGASFSNRAEAVLKWFAGRADVVFSAE